MMSLLTLVLLWACISRGVDAWAGPTSTGSSTDVSSPSFISRRLLFKTAVVGGAAAAAGTLDVGQAVAAEAPYAPPPHSMDNKVVVITGGNTGLGLESAKRLAAAGATVVLTSRSLEKGQEAVDSIQSYVANKGTANNNVFVLPLDLCDLDNVKAFPQLLSKKLNGKSVDVLMNNAGVMAVPDRRITKDGFEKTFQTNHLGHFALSAKLLPLLSDGARVINVSSEGWKFASGGLELDNLNGEKKYGPWSSYGQSKLSNILFTEELQTRANAAGRSLTAVSLHPGAVQTDLGRFVVGEEKWESMKQNGMSLQDKLLFVPLSKLTKTVEDGASTQVYLAAGEGGSDVGGKYFIDCKKAGLEGAALDMDKAKELWTLSEKLTGVQFNL